jgi:hypothetical protein
MRFIESWHTQGTVDRAVVFMVTSGRSEFAPLIWPLIASADDNVSFGALRAARRFRPVVLGADASEKLRALPAKAREHVLAEIAHNSGMDGMELAAEVAKADESPDIQASLIKTLQFRHAERLVRDLLASAPEEVWQELADDDYGDEISDPTVSARLRELRDKAISQDPDPMHRIELLLRVPKSSAAGAAMAQACEVADFATSEAAWTLARAYERYPDEIVAALIRRLEAGLEVPSNSEELLRRCATVDVGPISDRVLGDPTSRAASSAILLAGPRTVRALIERVLALHAKATAGGGQLSADGWKEHHQLVDLLARSRLSTFTQAWREFASTDKSEEIGLMADIFARHGMQANEQEVFSLDDQLQVDLTAICSRWIDVLSTASSATRGQFADLARMVARVGSEALVDPLARLLTEDLAQWRQAREAFQQAPHLGEVGAASGARIGYIVQYSRAFAAIGGEHVAEIMRGYLQDPDFGGCAAEVLRETYEVRSGKSKNSNLIRSRVDYSQAAVRRVQRRRGVDTASPEGDAILDATARLLRPEDSEREQALVMRLALIGLSIPHHDRPELLARLLGLTLQNRELRHLLAALVLDGEVISADTMLGGIRAWLQEANRGLAEPGELESWLCLLPYSDRPWALLEGIDMAGTRARRVRHFRQLVVALRHASVDDLEVLWVELLRRDPDLLNEHDWLSLMLDSDKSERCLFLLDLLCDPIVPKPARGMGRWWASHLLVRCLRSSAEVWRGCLHRYEDPAMQPCHDLLNHAFAEDPDGELAFAMIRRYASTGRPFDEVLRSTMEKLVIERRSVPEWGTAYELHGIDATQLRRDLFALTRPRRAEATIAEACLVTIDRLRDEYGRADAEPRHPDISEGRPWPLRGDGRSLVRA